MRKGKTNYEFTWCDILVILVLYFIDWVINLVISPFKWLFKLPNKNQ